MAPLHPVGENPTLALKRDLELIQWLDALGYDEAWVGEHHSAGWELIASPELFMATAAERTRQIKLGTGVISLPYHHPLMVANRMVQLDHLTEGRAMLGVGPGALTTDALMLGIDPNSQREMMDESMDVIMRLMTDPTPLTYDSSWFRLRDAVLQLRPFTQPHMPIAVASQQSPSGPLLAGKHGGGILSLGVFTGLRGAVDLKKQWAIAEQTAAEHGKAMRREDWRLVVPIYLAESRQQARDEVRQGAARHVFDYFERHLGRPAPDVQSPDLVVDRLADSGAWVVGTPDDCIAAIERFDELSGGFGGLMALAHEWAPRDKVQRSFELLARYVMPRFQGALVGIEAASRWAQERNAELHATGSAALERAYQAYERSAAGRPS
jgi:limonene 1,2-monooxygenase